MSLPGSIMMPVGMSSAPILVTPINNSTASGTVVLTLQASDSYTVGAQSSDTVDLTQPTPPASTQPVVTVAVTSDPLSGAGGFVVRRTGDLTYTVSGTATSGQDYAGLAANYAIGTVNFLPGDTTETLSLTPVDGSPILTAATAIVNLLPDYVGGPRGSPASWVVSARKRCWCSTVRRRAGVTIRGPA
jgi:hypothetical protein